MEYIYGALLLHSAGKEINEENLVNVLKAAGIEPDTARIKALVSALEEVDIEEAIKTSAMPMVAAAPQPATSAAQPAEEEKKEEEEKKKEEEEKKKEEEAIAGLGALFG